jgi:hypothetical protein
MTKSRQPSQLETWASLGAYSVAVALLTSFCLILLGILLV